MGGLGFRSPIDAVDRESSITLGLRVRVQSLGCRFKDLGFRVDGPRGLGFRVRGVGV